MLATTAPAAAQMITLVNRQGETVRIGGGRVQVASQSAPGTWHDVTLGVCDCLSFRHRGTCRHIAFSPRRPEPPTPTVPATCPRCGCPTTARDASALAKMNQCARCTNELLWGPDDAA